MNINKTQRIIVILVAVFIVATLLFPPFHMVNNGATRNAGYSFIIYPPTKYATVDTSMLITQWIAVLFIGILLFILNNHKSCSNQKKDTFIFSEQTNELKNTNDKNYNISNNFNYKIITIFFIVLFASFFSFIGQKHGEYFSEKYIKNIIYNFNYSLNLKIKKIENLQLSILSFGEFKEVIFDIPKDLKDKFVMFRNIECKSEYIDIVCSKIVSNPQWEFNIDGGASNIMDSVLKLDGISNESHLKRNINKFDMNGTYFEAEYSKDNIQKKMIGIILGKGENTWQVSIIFHKSFNNIAEKILNSLIIHNATPNSNAN